MTTAKLIAQTMARGGAMTVAELSAATRTGKATVRAALNRSRKAQGFYITAWRGCEPVWNIGGGHDDHGRQLSDVRVMAWLEQHGPSTGAQVHAGMTDLCRDSVDQAIKRLRRSGRVHISGWQPQREIPGRAASVFKAGSGVDAEKPEFPKSRGWEERQKLRRMAMSL